MEGEKSSALIEALGIVKRFPGVLANDGVNLDVRRGEVHALLGENGAGKSTLSKILYGYHRADAGEIRVEGKPAAIHSPRDARALGIGMVFQNFTLIPALSVLENIALFLPDLPPVVRSREVVRRIEDFADRFHLSVDPMTPVRRLSIGDRQKVEILKLLLANARVLILDEPTKVLAPHEVDALFGIFQRLKTDGYAILFITHKLREVLACADRITVMRQGRVVGTVQRSAADEGAMVSLMFGQPLVENPESDRAPIAPGGRSLLELQGAWTAAARGQTALREIDLDVREGEIVGVAGVSGNGQKELGDLILGLLPLTRGTKILGGEDASSWSIARVRESGIAFIPEDPLTMACVPGMSVRENMALGTGRRYRSGVSLDWPRMERDMHSSFRRLEFPAPPFQVRIGTLSGGNLQRAIVAREMAPDPKLVVALYPTRGLDVRSAVAVRALMRVARGAGSGVLLISEDLDELFSLSDRLVVMFGGTVAGELMPREYRAAEVGRLMTGSTSAPGGRSEEGQR